MDFSNKLLARRLASHTASSIRNDVCSFHHDLTIGRSRNSCSTTEPTFSSGDGAEIIFSCDSVCVLQSLNFRIARGTGRIRASTTVCFNHIQPTDEPIMPDVQLDAHFAATIETARPLRVPGCNKSHRRLVAVSRKDNRQSFNLTHRLDHITLPEAATACVSRRHFHRVAGAPAPA